jgi:hypothetical protein
MVEFYGDGDEILGTEFPEYLNSHLSLYNAGRVTGSRTRWTKRFLGYLTTIRQQYRSQPL